MTNPEITKLKNVSVIAHGGGGATTLVEALLYNAKEITEMGTPEKGNMVMVTEPEEADKEITLTPHIGYFKWKDSEVNIADCPGYVNFLEGNREVFAAMDSGIVVVEGGVKAETERLWNMTRSSNAALIGFVNKLDSVTVDITKLTEEVEKILNVPACPLTYPIGKGENLKGYIDLISMTAYSDQNGKIEKIDLPDQEKEEATAFRLQLIEKVVENNDELLEQYLEGNEPSETALKDEIKKAVLAHTIFPIFCGSAKLNIGVKGLADAIIDYLPNPQAKNEMYPLKAVDANDKETEVDAPFGPEAPLTAKVFKTYIDTFSGQLSYVRVISGVLEEGKNFTNTTRVNQERCGNLFKIQGKTTTRVNKLVAGEIGAIGKLKDTHTGDTLCDAKTQIIFKRPDYTVPILSYALEIEGKAEDKVAVGMNKLMEEDPTLTFFMDKISNEMIVAGMGQTHLQITLEKLKRKYGATATLKAPKIPYRETLKKRVRVQGKLKKQSGGHGQFGDCWIEAEPLPRGTGFEFESKIVGGAIPKQYIPSVERGVREALETGHLAGYPIVDLKVTLVDGSYHAVDSSDYAFKVAGSFAIRNAMEQSGASLLEPIMFMEITVPEDRTGDVLKDLNSRRSQVMGIESNHSSQRIKAKVPMDEVLEYGNILHSLTSGQGIYTMEMAGYQEANDFVTKTVVNENEKKN